MVEQLEDRSVPAPLTFVNDTWHLFLDADASGTVTANDIVTNANDPGSGPPTGYLYGVQAFGTVTSGPFVGPGSLPAFDEINDAIANTDAGGTVTVLQGTYNELVQVNKTLTLLGAQAGVDARTRTGVPESVINGNAGTTSFFVTADDVTIDGFTVQGQTNVNQFGAGIVLGAGTSGSQVLNNIIQDNVVGLFLANDSATSQAVVSQNLFRDNDNPGSANGTGIYTDQFVSGPTLTNVLIADNRFTGNNFTWGINLQNATAATITGNDFETGNAVRLANVDNSSFTGNDFSGALVPTPPSGFQITALNITSGSDTLAVTGNTFTNRLASAVSVSGLSGNLTFSNNTITQDVSLFAPNSNRAMVSLTGLAGVSNVSENTITLTGAMPSGAGVNGIAVQGNFTNTVNVTANVINGGNTDTFTGTNDSHGIGIFGGGLGLPSTPTPVFSTVNVSNNFVNGWVDGIASPQALNSRTTVTINNNDLSGNSHLAILASTTPTSNLIDASGNWFGSSDFATVAALVNPGARVDFTPYLNSGTDTSPAPGFQGDFSSLTAHAAGFQVGSTGRIQEGVNLVTAGGTVNVGPGTYAESVNVNKTVALLGAQAGVDARTRVGASESIVDDSANTGRTPFNVTASDVTIDGFTVQGTTNANQFGFGILLGIGTSGSEIRNNIIQNNIAGLSLANNSATNQTVISQNLFLNNNQPGPVSGTGIYTDQFNAGGALTNVLIASNAFTNNSNAAVLLGSTQAGSQSNIAISNNTMTGNGNGALLFNLLASSFTGNTVTGSTGSQLAIGGGVDGLTVSGNVIAGGATRGIRIGDFGGGGTNQNVAINNNSISGNPTAGLEIDATAGAFTGTLDASGNWWGNASGPTIASNPGGTGDAIVDAGGQVDYSPWLSTPTDTSAAVGFQGNFSQLTVNAGSPASAAQGGANNIQDGINQVTPGGTVVALAGTYPGPVDVNKAATLAGNATITGPLSASVAGAVLSPGTGGGAGLFTSGDLTLAPGSTFVADLTGLGAGTGHDQLSVTGTVTFGGSLVLNSTFTPAPGTSLVLVSNDAADAVVGTFAGLPEGSVITAGGTQYALSYAGGDGNDVTVTVPVPPPPPPPPPPAPPPPPLPPLPPLPPPAAPNALFAVGAGAGGGSVAQLYNQNGSLRFAVTSFPGFNGEVHVATGDVNGDLVEDLIVGAGPGAGGHVKVFDGVTGAEVRSFFAFTGFNGGVFVGAGDVNNDGRADIIAGAGAGPSGGHVKVFDGLTGAEVRSFLAFPGFSGGVTVAGGDVNNDTFDDIIVGANGATGGHVKVFDGLTGVETRSYFAYPGFLGGVNVGAGDINGDGFAEVITGANESASHVKAFDGLTGAEVLSFLAFPGFPGGVRVGTVDRDGDTLADVLVGAGPGGGPHVKVFDPFGLPELSSFFAFDADFEGGVFVG